MLDGIEEHRDSCPQCTEANRPTGKPFPFDTTADPSRYCDTGKRLNEEYVVTLGPPGK
jgi:hypothetical protein